MGELPVPSPLDATGPAPAYTTPHWLRRLTHHVGASIAVWFIGGFFVARRLEWEVAEDYRTGLRTSTDGDSIGLPLGTFLVLWTALILVANVCVAFWTARRRSQRQLHSRMTNNPQSSIDAAAAIVDPQGFRIAQAQERVTALEHLLSLHGVAIQPGTQLEQVALSVFDALYQRDRAAPDPSADIRVGFKHLIGLNELSGLLLGLQDHPEFPTLIPHLRLLNEGLGIQNMPSAAVDQATNKVFELYMALLALQCGNHLELDDETSQGRNPDVLITISARRWGLACKALHGTNPEGFIQHLEKGIDQIEKSPAETGVVVFTIKNIIDQSRYWLHTNPEGTSHGAEAEFSAFNDPQGPFALLREDANAIGHELTKYLPEGYLNSAFAGKKCIPGFLICAHVVSAVAFEGIPVPTSVKLMAWQHVGTTRAEDMIVLNCLHEAAYAFDKSTSRPAR